MTMMDSGVIPDLDAAMRLELARRHAGLTQDQLAAELELSVATIRRYENRQGTAKRPTLLAWAAVTGVSYEWLTSYTPSDSNREPIDYVLAA